MKRSLALFVVVSVLHFVLSIVGMGFGYTEIAAVSVLFGAAAVGLLHLWRAARVHHLGRSG